MADRCPLCMAPLALSVKRTDDDYVVTCPRCMAEVHVQPEGITFRVGGQPANLPRRTATFACIGPVNPGTNLPGETCGKEASKYLWFPHRDGLAFMFACDDHAMSLGSWAGRRFGGCFTDKIDKAAGFMREAATKVRVDTPHADQFATIVRAPKAPNFESGGRGTSPN
jgi:hypothetical protein